MQRGNEGDKPKSIRELLNNSTVTRAPKITSNTIAALNTGTVCEDADTGDLVTTAATGRFLGISWNRKKK